VEVGEPREEEEEENLLFSFNSSPSAQLAAAS